MISVHDIAQEGGAGLMYFSALLLTTLTVPAQSVKASGGKLNPCALVTLTALVAGAPEAKARGMLQVLAGKALPRL
jgi:hypothetical protein